MFLVGTHKTFQRNCWLPLKVRNKSRRYLNVYKRMATTSWTKYTAVRSTEYWKLKKDDLFTETTSYDYFSQQKEGYGAVYMRFRPAGRKPRIKNTF